MCSLLTIPPPSSPSLFVFRAQGGRLGARMTAYSMLLVLRWEYNVSVLVDRATMDYLDQAFQIQVRQKYKSYNPEIHSLISGPLPCSGRHPVPIRVRQAAQSWHNSSHRARDHAPPDWTSPACFSRGIQPA